MPAWALSPGLEGVPYVVSRSHQVVGVLFADQLIAGRPTGPAGNKILWLVRKPMQAGFRVTATPAGRSEPQVSVFRPVAGPSFQYPSLDNVPTSGCWTFRFQSGDNTDSVALLYRS